MVAHGVVLPGDSAVEDPSTCRLARGATVVALRGGGGCFLC
jgi:hypothetical protein